MVGRSLEPERWIGQPAPMERTLLLRRLGRRPGQRRRTPAWTASPGSPASPAPARCRGWCMSAFRSMPRSARRARAHASLLLGLGMLAIGLVLAAWVARRIARPLRQLSADARLLGEGRFEHRTEVRTGSEIGLLAHTLNRMAAALQERIAAARRSEERLTLALEGSRPGPVRLGHRRQPHLLQRPRLDACVAGPTSRSKSRRRRGRSTSIPTTWPGGAGARPRGVRRADADLRSRVPDPPSRRSLALAAQPRPGGRARRRRPAPCAWSAPIPTSPGRRRQAAAAPARRVRRPHRPAEPGPVQRPAGERDRARPAQRQDHGPAVPSTSITSRASTTRAATAPATTLLRIVAERLLATVRGVDTVARLAGDEFTVILEGLTEPADAEVVAMKMVEALRPPMRIGDALVSVSTSVGLAVLADADVDAASLLRARRRGALRGQARRPRSLRQEPGATA